MISQQQIAAAWNDFANYDLWNLRSGPRGVVLYDRRPQNDPQRIKLLAVAIGMSLQGLRDTHRCAGRECDLCIDPGMRPSLMMRHAVTSWRIDRAKCDTLGEPSRCPFP